MCRTNHPLSYKDRYYCSPSCLYEETELWEEEYHDVAAAIEQWQRR